MLEEHLCEIGLNKREAKVYLELLKIGDQAVSVLAKRLNYKRSSMYSILKSLMGKGLLSTSKMNGAQYFRANDPNSLIAYLDSKSRHYDFQRSQTLSIIPKFRELNSEFNFSKPIATFCEGEQSLDYLLRNAFSESDFLYSYFPIETKLNDYLKFFLSESDELFCEEPEKELRVIFPNSSEISNFVSSLTCMTHSNKKAIFLNHDRFHFKSFVNIYSEKVIMVNLEQGMESAAIVDDACFASVQRTLFDLLWNAKS